MRNFIFLVRGPPKKWGFSVLAKKPEIYDKCKRVIRSSSRVLQKCFIKEEKGKRKREMG